MGKVRSLDFLGIHTSSFKSPSTKEREITQAHQKKLPKSKPFFPKEPVAGLAKLSPKPSSGDAWIMMLYLPPEKKTRIPKLRLRGVNSPTQKDPAMLKFEKPESGKKIQMFNHHCRRTYHLYITTSVPKHPCCKIVQLYSWRIHGCLFLPFKNHHFLWLGSMVCPFFLDG